MWLWATDFMFTRTVEIEISNNQCAAQQDYLSEALYVTGIDKSRLGRTHQANSFSTTNR